MSSVTDTSQFDPFIVISGGLVQNTPALPVFDLDLLDSDAPDEGTFEEVGSLRDRVAAFVAERGRTMRDRTMREYQRLSASQSTELQRIIDDCDRWLSSHTELDQVSPRP